MSGDLARLLTRLDRIVGESSTVASVFPAPSVFSTPPFHRDGDIFLEAFLV
jgi:hypothetical protein